MSGESKKFVLYVTVNGTLGVDLLVLRSSFNEIEDFIDCVSDSNAIKEQQLNKSKDEKLENFFKNRIPLQLFPKRVTKHCRFPETDLLLNKLDYITHDVTIGGNMFRKDRGDFMQLANTSKNSEKVILDLSTRQEKSVVFTLEVKKYLLTGIRLKIDTTHRESQNNA